MSYSIWPASDPIFFLPFKWFFLLMCLLLLYCQITVLPDKNKEMNSVVGVYSCIVYTLLSSSNAVLLLPDCPHVSRYLNHCLSLSEFLSGIPPIYYLIGVWQPQKYFWMLILFVHFPAKLLVGSVYGLLF